MSASLEKRRTGVILEHVRAPHVATQHIETLVPRLVGDAQDRGAAFSGRRYESGPKAVPGELRRIESRELGVTLHDLGDRAVGERFRLQA